MSVIRRQNVPVISNPLLIVNLGLDVFAHVLLVLFLRVLDGFIHELVVALLTPDDNLLLVQCVHALQDQVLASLLVFALVFGTLAQTAPRLLEKVIEQFLTGRQDAQTGLVGESGLGDLLGHASLLEFLLVLGVDAVGLLAYKVGLFDAELFVGLEVDFACLFHCFLSDEGGHLPQLGGYL